MTGVLKRPDSKTVGPNFVEGHIIECEEVATKGKESLHSPIINSKLNALACVACQTLITALVLNTHVYFLWVCCHATYCLQMLPETFLPEFKTSVYQELECFY